MSRFSIFSIIHTFRPGPPEGLESIPIRRTSVKGIPGHAEGPEGKAAVLIQGLEGSGYHRPPPGASGLSPNEFTSGGPEQKIFFLIIDNFQEIGPKHNPGHNRNRLLKTRRVF
jgi:hypothetical protein